MNNGEVLKEKQVNE